MQAFTIVRNGTVNISNFPRFTITGRLEDVNPATGLYEAIPGGDFTGANAITFPGEMANRTEDQRQAILQIIARMLIEMKAGVWSP